MKKEREPFRLNCFGFLGILLLLSGIGSGIVVYYTIMENLK
tara:strand:- start:533 stop:655 length:123 start_codon:yes stop_codon:yes gene_type:complete